MCTHILLCGCYTDKTMVSYDFILIANTPHQSVQSELIGVEYLLDQSDKTHGYNDSLTNDINDDQDVDEGFEYVDETIATFPIPLTELSQQ